MMLKDENFISTHVKQKYTELSAVAILGFQFELYHVVALLSVSRSISLASLFAKNVPFPLFLFEQNEP